MAVTSKGKSWELRHSLWIAWTFTLGFFNWIAFFYIGIRAKRRRWLLWGLVYAIPFILAMATVDRPAFDGWVGDLVVALTLILGIASIVHAFRVRKEYLLRLEATQRSRTDTDAALRQRIQTEHSSSAQSPASGYAPGQTSTAAPNPSPVRPAESHDQAPIPPTPSAAPQSPTVDLNSASEQEIASLPGVGVIIAKRAVSLRESRGGFHTVDDFGQALNLKPHVVERLRPLVSLTPPQQSGRPDSSGRIVDF